jgi:hypothetical protein
MKKVINYSIFIISLIELSSCEKKEKDWDNDQSAAVNFKIESAFDEMTNISDQAVNGSLVYYKSGKIIISDVLNPQAIEKTPCNVIITHDTTSTQKVLTVDYGTTNCDCNDGKTRRGKIITTYTGAYLDSGTVITHTTENYYVNNIKIEGTKTVTNMGLNNNGLPYFNIQINGQVTLTSGTVVNYTSTRVRTWNSGYSTPLNRMDDVYDISGNTAAVYSTGGGYTANTTTSIRIRVGCGYPTQGVLELTPVNKPVRTINYGDDNCDSQYTVTIDGNTYTFN